MTPEQIDHVFGRGRLKMDTGAHVEVFREAAPPGESRRYTKRFLTTADGDYAQWTEREWRILALLVGHGSRCVPDIVQYDRDEHGTKLVQTYDAGATVDQWATLLPVERDGGVYARVFEDCAHWWALAHHCLVALEEIHSLQLVHLDIKGDNICIPIGPAEFDPAAPGERLFAMFGKLRLIDFAFSLVSGESLPTPLPIGWQQDYDYQSPRLLHALEAGRTGNLRPTENLDWRCDMYSLGAMLKRYLPGERRLRQAEPALGWTVQRYDAAKSLILKIREAHDGELTSRRPHSELIMETSAHVRANELAQSLEQGWTLAHTQPFAVPATPLTPVTRLAPPLRLVIPRRDDVIAADGVWPEEHRAPPIRTAKRRDRLPLIAVAASIAALGILVSVADSGAFLGNASQLVVQTGRAMAAAMNRVIDPEAATVAVGSPDAGAGRESASLPAGQPLAEATPETMAATEGAPTGANAATERLATPRDAPAAVPETAESPQSPDTPQSPASSPGTEPPAESAVASRASDADAPAPSSLARVGRAASAPSSPSPRVSGSRGRQLDGYRSKPVPPSSQFAKSSSPPTTNLASALPPRPAETSRRTQVAGVNKTPASTTSTRVAAIRSPQVATAKRAVEPAFVASRSPPRVLPAPAASMGTAGGASSATPSVSVASAGTVSASPSSNDASNGAGTPAQTVTIAPSSPQVIAAISPVSQPASQPASTQRAASVPLPLAPPAVEAPRASSAVTYPLSGASGSAPSPQAPPVVEMPRASSAATYPLSSAPGSAPIVEAPPSLSAPIVVAPRISPPRASAPPPQSRASPGEIRDGDAYRAQARWILENVVPRTSAQSHAQISRVLLIAASAYNSDQDRAVTAAAASPGVTNDVSFVAHDFAPLAARRWHEEARHAYWSRRDIPDALDLQLKAFGANPYDPEIAGHLAFLYMKMLPAQPDRARQLALHAIGLRNGQYQTGRAEDWMTFAISSALTGRETDAKYGFYALVALTRDADRVCRMAQGALALYGERLREPVDALMYRMRMQGRSDDSPNCAGASRISRYP